MTREARIWALTTIVLVGLLLAIRFHYKLGHYEGLGYPYNTFLFKPADAGNDFYNIDRPVVAGHPYDSSTSVYFPFTYLPLYLIRFLNEEFVLFLLVALFTGVLGRIIWNASPTLPRGPRTIVTIILTLLTYPYLFCVDRGNLEMMTFLFLAGFVFFLRKDRSLIAAVFLGAAAAMKGYPAMFGLIFLARRQVRPFVAAMTSALALTIGSAALYPGGVRESFAKLQHHLATFSNVYLSTHAPWHFNGAGMQHNASYFGFVRTLELMGILPYTLVDVFERFYVPFAAIAGLVITGWVLFIERSLWRQMALIAAAVILLPQVSFDYKLILLLFPIALFLEKTEPGRLDRLWVLTFGLLLIPKSYAWIAGDITISVILTPILLTLVCLLAFNEGFTSRNAAGESSADT